MSEQPTTTADHSDPLAEAYEMSQRAAARRMAISEADQENKNIAPLHSPEDHMKRIVRGAVAATAITSVAIIGANVLKEPQPSEETTRVTVQPGEGLQSIAEVIPGSEKDLGAAINSIAGDPANIDVLKDGLQPGEKLTVPIRFN